MINKYLIENNTLVRLESYDLTQNIKQFDITNVIVPKLMDINKYLKEQINEDKNVNFFDLNDKKNIVIFRLKVKEIGSQDFILFDLDHFDFIGSFSETFENQPCYESTDMYSSCGQRKYRSSFYKYPRHFSQETFIQKNRHDLEHDFEIQQQSSIQQLYRHSHYIFASKKGQSKRIL
eukprot:403345251